MSRKKNVVKKKKVYVKVVASVLLKAQVSNLKSGCAFISHIIIKKNIYIYKYMTLKHEIETFRV